MQDVTKAQFRGLNITVERKALPEKAINGFTKCFTELAEQVIDRQLTRETSTRTAA